MNKRTSVIVLSIVLTGVLVYFLSSGVQLDKAPVVTGTPVSPSSSHPPAGAVPSPQEKHWSTQEHVHSENGNTDVSATASPVQQQVPALEPEIREALGHMLNTSSEGLVEETHNGTTSVNLQGRFQTVPVATIDENGNVQVTDYSHLPKTRTQP